MDVLRYSFPLWKDRQHAKLCERPVDRLVICVNGKGSRQLPAVLEAGVAERALPPVGMITDCCASG